MINVKESVFDVEMRAHYRTLVLPHPFELLPAGAAHLYMHAIRLVGGVGADEVVKG